MATDPRTPSSRSARKLLPGWLAGVFDAGLIGLFTAIGRRSHEQGVTLTGVLETAWPFWAGAALGWVATAVTRRRAPRTIGDGLVVLLSTVVVGMALRQLTDQGTAWSFVVVTTLVLAAFLLGWRALAALLRR
ncbi:Protein of unknown function [Kytococcus aerolatus]|uniref:DUF3054 domain-containing protein n=1 Tax=Kytococcus aerolatus TaxID=592308 RepID=A0A212T254_9MICO|nr:DUF3054 domain-containing protein [Kytococcus aerolatus]SNC59936.1 Protein of unknown function [Kytococcus aerolatus]